MISVVNKGEETGSNLFVIAIACVMLPAFLYGLFVNCSGLKKS